MEFFGVGSGSGCFATLILGRSETEDGPEDEAQKDQAQCGAYATTEALRELVEDDQEHDDIHEGDEQENDPPDRLANDFEQHDGIVDGNDGGPTGFAGLREDLPHGGDHQQDNGKVNENDEEPRTCGGTEFSVTLGENEV